MKEIPPITDVKIHYAELIDDPELTTMKELGKDIRTLTEGIEFLEKKYEGKISPELDVVLGILTSNLAELQRNYLRVRRELIEKHDQKQITINGRMYFF